jgi:hypothetical protein
MEELIRINNKWVKLSDWKTAVTTYTPIKKTKAEHYMAMAVKASQSLEVLHQSSPQVKKEVKYNDFPDVDFRGDEVIEVNKLSEKWQGKVTLSEDLKELRGLLGWPLYQEWLKETVTGY